MKKGYLILSISCLFALGLASYLLIPTIQRGMKVNRLNELQDQYLKCEQIKVDAHKEANELRKELGLVQGQQVTPSTTGTITLTGK